MKNVRNEERRYVAMQLQKEDVIQYASRYIDRSDMKEFAGPGELFAMFQREKDPARAPDDDSGWEFMGYGYCRGYILDEQAKPRGKWLWMEHLFLGVYPPLRQSLRLQPPHVVLGRFSSADRSRDVLLEKVEPSQAPTPQQLQQMTQRYEQDDRPAGTGEDTDRGRDENTGDESDNGNILAFPGATQ
jgi:hypothetical protein